MADTAKNNGVGATIGKPKKTTPTSKTATATAKPVAKSGIDTTKKVVKETSKETNEKVLDTIKVPTTVDAPKKTFSLEERIQRVKLLDSLSNKRQKAVNTLNELRQFQFGADDSCELELTDSSKKGFRTGNSNLIGLLTNHLDGLLVSKIKELDTEIMAFEL